MITGLCLVSCLLSGCSTLVASPAPAGPSPNELTTEQLIGYAVVDSEGGEIGPVDGAVMGIESGEVQYVIVLIKDKYHFGKGASGPAQDQFLLVPWPRLELDAARQTLVVDCDTAYLEQAPLLDALPDTSQPDWDSAIRQYWANP
jgi:sporulation protein YlmC with PRC-barrel domain